MLASAKSARLRHLRLRIENQTSTKRTQTRLIRRALVMLGGLPWLLSRACRRWVVQRHSQVNLDRRPCDSHLLDQQTYELLTLLEIECIDAGSNASCEGLQPCASSAC